MNYRTLITYSPYLLPLLVVLWFLLPGVSIAGFNDIGQGLFEIVIAFLGFFAGLAAGFLDYTINTFVIDFGINVTGSGIGAAIDSMWSVVRDLFNIIFIFAIVYLGFKMILGSDESGTQRALVYLVIAALLVNFSLFISKFVVDFSNILAEEVALSAFPRCESIGATGVCDDIKAGEADVGGHFFRQMKLPTTLNTDAKLLNGERVEWGYIFGLAIVYAIAIFAFLAGAIMLLIRYAALCVFMVLSPFMFIGWVLPQYKGLMQKYWSGFLGRAFYAPIYILMIYFSAAVVEASFANLSTDITNYDIGKELSGVAFAASGIGAGFGPFVLSAVLLIMSVQVASKLGADGAGTAMRVGGNLANRAKRGAVAAVRAPVRGVGGFAARTAGERLAEPARRRLENRAANWQQSDNRWTRSIGRLTERTAGRALRGAENISVAGSETTAQRRQRVQEQQRNANNIVGQQGREQDLAAARSDLASATTEKDREAARNRIGSEIRKMSQEELLRLGDDVKLTEIAAHLTEDQVKTLADSGEFGGSKIKAIKDARTEGTINRFDDTLNDTSSSAEDLNTALDNLARSVQGMSTEHLSGLKIGQLTNQRVATNLSDKQIEEIEKSGRFSASEITSIKSARANGQIATVSGSAPDIVNDANPESMTILTERREKMFQQSAQVIGKLPPAVFKDPTVTEYITPAMLQQRVRNGLSQTDINDIAAKIKAYAMRPGASSKELKRWKDWSDKTPEGAKFNFS